MSGTIPTRLRRLPVWIKHAKVASHGRNGLTPWKRDRHWHPSSAGPIRVKLAEMKVLLSLVLLLQSVRMTEDFLPLEAGNQWTYDVTNASGQKINQFEFSVGERTIVAGRSLYAVSGYPFSGESRGPNFIGYDRDTRQFIRVSNGEEAPLFPGDAESTEVLQSDTNGIPQKFALKTASTTLVFQRGVGIVEARLQAADGVHIAKLQSSKFGRGTTAASPAARTEAAAPAAPAARPIPTVAPVTSENPRLVVSAEPAPGGLKLEMLVVNASDRLLPFKFNSSQNYDFVITDVATGLEVWRWSRGTVFAQVIRSDSIRGNSKWTYTELWNRRDNDKNPVSPGRYRLVGILSSQPPIQSEPVMLEVQ
jgi:intracellular proteinase inhibitor BsuPI